MKCESHQVRYALWFICAAERERAREWERKRYREREKEENYSNSFCSRRHRRHFCCHWLWKLTAFPPFPSQQVCHISANLLVSQHWHPVLLDRPPTLVSFALLSIRFFEIPISMLGGFAAPPWQPAPTEPILFYSCHRICLFFGVYFVVVFFIVLEKS